MIKTLSFPNSNFASSVVVYLGRKHSLAIESHVIFQLRVGSSIHKHFQSQRSEFPMYFFILTLEIPPPTPIEIYQQS